MKWKAEYETGIAEIDGQHRTIIHLVSEFESAVSANVHWNDLDPLIARANDYARFHFAVEESLMQIFKYPKFAAHRSEHQFVLTGLSELKGRLLKTGLNGETLERFRIWMLGHFLESDRHFFEFVRAAKSQDIAAIGVGASPRV